MFSHFFLIFLFTILATRIFLYVKPTASPTVEGFRLHHYMYGIIGIVIGMACNSLTLFAIGLGLFIDELAFLIMRGKITRIITRNSRYLAHYSL